MPVHLVQDVHFFEVCIILLRFFLFTLTFLDLIVLSFLLQFLKRILAPIFPTKRTRNDFLFARDLVFDPSLHTLVMKISPAANFAKS